MLSFSQLLPFLFFSGGEGYYQSLIMLCQHQRFRKLRVIFQLFLGVVYFEGLTLNFKAWMFLSHLPSSLMGPEFHFLFLLLHEFASSSAKFSTSSHF